MRICLCTDTFLPEINGVTTVLAAMRAELLARGHSVFIIAPEYAAADPSELSGDESIVRLGSIPCPGYRQVHLSWPWGRGLAGRIARFDPHVVHAVTEGPIGVFGRQYARRRRLPLATSFHTDFPRYAREYLGPWAVPPTRAWVTRFHSAAALTMTPSERTRKELVAMKVPSPVLWGRGVDAAWFNPNRRSRQRRETRGGDHRVHVLHVGRLATEKDVDTLIAAFQRAHHVLTDSAVFCVAGDGPRAREVRAALPFAMHYGFLQRDDLADLYADADLFVFPSATETCGLVVLEALASRLPVIAANAGGVPENVMDGRTGLLITPRNADGFSQAIVALTIDSAERNAMAEAARVFAQGRGWGREMDALESIYASIAQSTSEVATPNIWPATTSVG